MSILLKKELINLDDVSIDGTKIKSVANKYSNVYRGTLGYHERNIEEKIAKSIKLAVNAVENIASLLDDDAVFIKMKDDSFDSKILSTGYNIQQANSNGFIIATTVRNVVSGDAGYGSLENYEYLKSNSINYLIPYINQNTRLVQKFKKSS